jgi:tetratricopeptide (TPR) repeat protein
LQQSQPEDSIVRKIYAMIIQCNRNLRRPDEALRVCEEARRHYPEDLEILFQEALTRRDLGDRSAAIACLERVLERRDGQHFASIDTGLQGYKTRHNLAVFLQEEGRTDDAEKQWQLAIAEQPTFIPALTGLAEIYFARRNWEAFQALVDRLRAVGKGGLEAQTLLARKHLFEKNFTLARLTIEQAIAAYAGAIWPRVILTHILLKEGTDWMAAEKALRDVLTLDPNHEEAQRNLAVLLDQVKKSPSSTRLD